MIGCDIIDIAYTRSSTDWQRKGFLRKIFTDKERSLIDNSSDPFSTVWRLWSMKETAYKANAYRKSQRSFNPTKLICQIHDDQRGEVQIYNHTYSTFSTYSDSYIFTLSNLPNIQSNVFKLPISNTYSPTYYCHKTLMDQIALDNNWDSSYIEISKSAQGLPFVLHNGTKQDIYISISHHGKFGGWSFL